MSTTKKYTTSKLLPLALGALGVVYGDIGTSPLYSVNEIFFGHSPLARSTDNIIGAISMIIWALTLIVTFKYIFIVLKAGNEGEGGVFALYSLILNYIKRSKFTVIITTLLVFGAGLLYGDGIITPAISVISAVEGMQIVTPAFTQFIVPITIVILTGLFLIQSRGTKKIGKVFGPIVVVWFLSIGTIGINQVFHNPEILSAFNPINAISFAVHTPIHELFVVMGLVVLAVTGGEAMFADMGHFGAKPIRLSWLSLVYPALLLNYLGQGAYLLGSGEVYFGNVFYSLVPSVLMIPMVILATITTVVASQALISGAYSITSQAVSLGFLPRIKIIHTNEDHHGQIYITFVNWLLYIGCILLVLIFQSSSNLASAYGLAESAIMVMTSVSVALVARKIWKWNWFKLAIIFPPFLILEALFLSANSLKIVQGGWIPLTVALSIYIIMRIWEWGRGRVSDNYNSLRTMTIGELITTKKLVNTKFNHPSVFMIPYPIKNQSDKVPAALQVFWNRYGILPHNIILLNVHVEKIPYSSHNRYEIYNILDHDKHGSITSIRINFGYMEDHKVEAIIKLMAKKDEVPISPDTKEWLIHLLSERIINKKETWYKNIIIMVFKFMIINSQSADIYYGLGNKFNLTVEAVPVKL